LGLTLLLIEKATHDPLYLWDINPSAPGENYSLLIIGDNNVGGDGGEVNGDGGGGDSVNGDGSGGTSPSRQGAETETSIPRNLSVAAVELRNFFWKITDCFRVWTLGGFK
jgi:hypothetical protein